MWLKSTVILLAVLYMLMVNRPILFNHFGWLIQKVSQYKNIMIFIGNCHSILLNCKLSFLVSGLSVAVMMYLGTPYIIKLMYLCLSELYYIFLKENKVNQKLEKMLSFFCLSLVIRLTKVNTKWNWYKLIRICVCTYIISNIKLYLGRDMPSWIIWMNHLCLRSICSFVWYVGTWRNVGAMNQKQTPWANELIKMSRN